MSGRRTNPWPGPDWCSAAAARGTIGLGREFSTWGEALFGYERIAGEVDTRGGIPTDEDDDLDVGALFVAFEADTLDDAGFPRSGMLGRTRIGYAHPAIGSDGEFRQIAAGLLGVRSRGRNTYRLGLDFLATVDGDAPVTHQRRLGGLFSLPGLVDNQFIGENLALLSTGYMRHLGVVASMDAYAGGNLHFGNMFEDEDDIDTNDMLWGAGAWVGIYTLLGPVYLGYGVAGESNRSLYILPGPQF